MSHNHLICRSCFSEWSPTVLREGPEAGEETTGAPVCPNCGNDTFGI